MRNDLILTNCRMCHSTRLELFLDLGFTPPSDSFLSQKQLKYEETYYPLQVYMCKDCGLAQLGYIVPPEKMYNIDYPYISSTTRTGVAHFTEMAQSICKKFQLKPKSLVVDLGSNVGVLLNGFKKCGMDVIGIEPVVGIMRVAILNGIDTIPALYSMEAVEQVIKERKKASILCATNVFAHINDLDAFMEATDKLLLKNGVFVFEAPYFLHLLENLEYDTIYHEHLSYLSIRPLVKFFERFGWSLFDIEETEIHGGSLRCFIARRGEYLVSPKIRKYLAQERKKKIHSMKYLQRFANKVKKHRQELRNLIISLKKKGKHIVGLSAPAKGNTLLNYCKLDTDLLDYVTEKAESKIGKYTPGTHIPVFSDNYLLKHRPDYALILAWNFAKEIMENNQEFKKRGGKFIIPVPKPKIV
jgi:SAM-dependent methyltransferase